MTRVRTPQVPLRVALERGTDEAQRASEIFQDHGGPYANDTIPLPPQPLLPSRVRLLTQIMVPAVHLNNQAHYPSGLSGCHGVLTEPNTVYIWPGKTEGIGSELAAMSMTFRRLREWHFRTRSCGYRE
jgi:hypothetical protein